MLLSIIIPTLHLYKIVFAFDSDFVSSKHFVDKTDLLREFLRHNGQSPNSKVVDFRNNYIACPAGFGKTSNLKMIRKFSEIEFDEKGGAKYWNHTESYRLFEKLKIFHNADQEGDIEGKHLARHPVLYFELDLDSDRDTRQDKIMSILNYKLLQSFKKYLPNLIKYRLKRTTDANSSAGVATTTTFERLLDQITELKMRKEDMPEFFGNLCQVLYNAYNQTPVIILVDEFDYLFNQGSCSIEILNTVYEVLFKIFDQMFGTSSACKHCIRVGMMVGVTTIAFRHYRFGGFSHVHYFSETNRFTPYFGFLENELDYLYNRYDCDHAERYAVSRYYAGYKTVDSHRAGLIRYNSYSISEYLKQRRTRNDNDDGSSSLPQFPAIQYGGPFRQTFIPSFLKDASYLDKVARLMKNCPIKDLFKPKYDHKSIKSFNQFLRHDFGNTELPFRNILYTFTIEQGFFAPIAENIYVIPNYDIRARFITYLRYNYEQRLRIDLNEISSCIREILKCPQNQPPSQLNTALTQTLNTAFEKFRPFREARSTLEFTHQLVIHIAALSYAGLQVVEDFPPLVSYNGTKFNPLKRSVTVVTFADTAAVFKITHNLPLQESLLRASGYNFRADRINRVKYVAIDVPYRNFTRIYIVTQNITGLHRR